MIFNLNKLTHKTTLYKLLNEFKSLYKKLNIIFQSVYANKSLYTY